jgi:hypothetical protein
VKRALALAAAGTACILVAAGVIVLRSRPPAKPPAEERTAVLRLPPEKILGIELSSAGGSVALEKVRGRWTVQAPFPVQLFEPAMNNLLFAFTRLDARRVVSEQPGDLAEFGLAPPAARGTARLEDGTRTTLLVGSPTPARDGYYLVVEGEPRLYVVADTIASYLSSTLADMRVRRVSTIDLEQLTLLRLRSAAAVLEARQKKPDELSRYSLTYGNYLMEKPYRRLRGVSSERFPGLLLKLDGLYIDAFVDDLPSDLQRYGLASPWGELVARDPSRDLHLLFGNRDGKGLVYFKEAAARAVYGMEEERVDFLRSLRPFEFVDKHIFTAEMQDVAGLRVSAGGRAWEMAYTPGAESEFTVNGSPVDAERFKSAYLGVAALYAEGEAAKVLTSTPDVSLRYAMLTGESVTVDFVPYDRSFYAVLMDGLSEFAISREQVARAVAAVEGLR